jgi:hypothetical protein
MNDNTPTRRRRKQPPAIIGVHEFANVFPMLSADELTDLAADISRNGLQNPLVVTPEGLLLEGRNRWEACKRAGVEPTVTVYDGDDPASFVLSANVSRRHLTPGQRAMAAAVVLQAAGRRVEGRWVRGSVVNPSSGISGINDSKTWQNAMSRAGIILDYAPEMVDAVIRGVKAFDRAFTEAEERRAPKKARQPKPAKPSTVAVQIADVRILLQRAKARELPESVLKDLSVLRREIDRILKDDLNRTG